jgi:3D (Asp-Asp-Asp) domain-containing protein
MIISRSTGRKIFATIVVSLVFVFVYEATIRDSRYAARQAQMRDPLGTPLPGTKLDFQATAYCKGTTTASGVNVRRGIAASDPNLLPVGSVISVSTGDKSTSGIYTIMDTGPAVQGRILDLYMWSCHEALAFGRRSVQVTVLRLGWNPRASTPGIIDALFRGRQVKKSTAEPKPPAPPEPPPPSSESVTPPQ